MLRLTLGFRPPSPLTLYEIYQAMSFWEYLTLCGVYELFLLDHRPRFSLVVSPSIPLGSAVIWVDAYIIRGSCQRASIWTCCRIKANGVS
jgi:hypothetical protein